jgi:hypothetical protein
MKKTDMPRHVRINLSPRTGKILGSYALIAMHGWFFAKLGLPSQAGGAEIFVGTYGVLANAPDAKLDERELAERNRAYFSAFKYLVAMTIAGGMIPEFLSKVFHFDLSVAVMKNFMLLMFTTALVLPGFVLAWADKSDG